MSILYRRFFVYIKEVLYRQEAKIVYMSYRHYIDKFLFRLHKHVYIYIYSLYEIVYIHYIDSVYEI